MTPDVLARHARPERRDARSGARSATGAEAAAVALAFRLAILLCLGSGCATFTQASIGPGLAAMGGVRLATCVVGDARFPAFPDKAMMVIDMPLSFVADLVLLPLAALDEWGFHDGIDVTADPLVESDPETDAGSPGRSDHGVRFSSRSSSRR